MHRSSSVWQLVVPPPLTLLWQVGIKLHNGANYTQIQKEMLITLHLKYIDESDT